MNSSQMNGYNKLFQAACKAYPDKMKPKIQDEIKILWKEIKNNEKNLDEELMKLNNIYEQRQGTYMKFWGRLPKQPKEPPVAIGRFESADIDNTPENISLSQEKISEDNKHTPAQTKLKNELSEIEKKIAEFHIIQSKVDLSQDHTRELQSLYKLKESLDTKLKILKSNQVS